jgi:hypothetical protein
MRAAGLPKPKEQYKAIESRRFKWDFAWPECKILVEVNGGTFQRMGHSTGAGIARDYEKRNLATLDGWHCLDFDGAMVRDGRALLTIREALDRFPPFG